MRARSSHTETNSWFTSRYAHHNHMKEEIENMRIIAQKMKDEKEALNQTTISFQLFLENLLVEQTFSPDSDDTFRDYSSFQQEMGTMIKKQIDSINILLWFTEEYSQQLEVADIALGLRSTLIRNTENNMNKKELTEIEVEEFSKTLREELEEFDSCMREKLQMVLADYQVLNRTGLQQISRELEP